jgi:hypothetical protein
MSMMIVLVAPVSTIALSVMRLVLFRAAIRAQHRLGLSNGDVVRLLKASSAGSLTLRHGRRTGGKPPADDSDPPE